MNPDRCPTAWAHYNDPIEKCITLSLVLKMDYGCELARLVGIDFITSTKLRIKKTRRDMETDSM